VNVTRAVAGGPADDGRDGDVRHGGAVSHSGAAAISCWYATVEWARRRDRGGDDRWPRHARPGMRRQPHDHDLPGPDPWLPHLLGIPPRKPSMRSTRSALPPAKSPAAA